MFCNTILSTIITGEYSKCATDYDCPDLTVDYMYFKCIDHVCLIVATIHWFNEYEVHENSKMSYKEDRDIILEKINV